MSLGQELKLLTHSTWRKMRLRPVGLQASKPVTNPNSKAFCLLWIACSRETLECRARSYWAAELSGFSIEKSVGGR